VAFETRLYELKEIEVSVSNKFGRAADFKVLIYQSLAEI